MWRSLHLKQQVEEVVSKFTKPSADTTIREEAGLQVLSQQNNVFSVPGAVLSRELVAMEVVGDFIKLSAEPLRREEVVVCKF